MDNAELQTRLQNALNALTDGSMTTMAELRGITPSELEAVYSVGYNYYRTGRIEEADKLFKFLCMFDHLNQKYWVGMGAVKQVQKDYRTAIACYGYAMFLDTENPKPMFHAAECYLATGDKESAREALASLLKNCPTTTENGRAYRAKALALQNIIDKLPDTPAKEA